MKCFKLFALFVLSLQLPALGQTPPAAAAGQLLSVSVMTLSSSTKQGGQGPTGSTTLSQTEYVYSRPNFGVGAVFLYDMHGSAEKDSAYGPKLELYLSAFYLEAAYLMSAKRAYTDRNISDQSGDGSLLGIGMRLPLMAGGIKWFMQASFKQRTMNLKKQDGVDLSEPIVQTDSYPMIGFGFQF